MKPGSHHFAAALAAAMAMLATPLPAAAEDVTVQPSPGSGFVVTNADKTAERLRVNENGAVTIPGSATIGTATVGDLRTPNYDSLDTKILVCADKTTGKLGRCSKWSTFVPGTAPIYVKKVTFDVGIDFPTYTYDAECDNTADMVIGGVAYNNWPGNRITRMDYQDYYFRVVLTITEPDQLNVTFTCMRTQ